MPFIIPVWGVVAIGVIVAGAIAASSKSEPTVVNITKEVVCNAHRPKWWLLVTAISSVIGAILSILQIIIFN
ncbi:hypothetical protein [Thiorhodospira sibirica]|uniref:hypothetical protein n=1 Tax=Thiorhodospira sibirica TaxID=154347 RepID=UPI0011125ABD|nr:hypothetical protein [Thiorhodospira sibirica]